MTNVSILNVAYRTSSALVAAIFCAYAVPTAFAYDHTSYNQTGLVIQYDGPDNGDNASTLVNLGSAGSAFNLASQTSDDKTDGTKSANIGSTTGNYTTNVATGAWYSGIWKPKKGNTNETSARIHCD